jgi:hypothetical protein
MASPEEEEEAMMIRFANLMLQGIEVLKFPASRMGSTAPVLRVLYMDVEQTALYVACHM